MVFNSICHVSQHQAIETFQHCLMGCPWAAIAWDQYFSFEFSVLAKFATWWSLLELELPHGHIQGLFVQLYDEKISSFFLVDKRNQMINSDLLLGVILSEICNYISSSFSGCFFC